MLFNIHAYEMVCFKRIYIEVAVDLGLKGKRVLVQGASSGLGFAIANAFALEGTIVAISSRDEARIQLAASKIPGAIPFACDLTQIGSGTKLVSDVIKKLGGVDILVTNTGGPPKRSFSALSLEDWQKGFEQLYLSAVESMKEVLPIMKEQKWGRILLSTSTAAKEPIAGLTISNSLRPGLLGLMKSVSLEVARDGITVNALLPGYTKTERLAELGITEEALVRDIPAGRLGTSEEYAALAVFLGSCKAGYITGQAIAGDGGLIRGL
jgi:3-oxoacyl-[acyl-carrier protein] reductase